jgi:Flp pilus assembly protein TadG
VKTLKQQSGQAIKSGRGGAQLRSGGGGAAGILSDESGQAVALTGLCFSIFLLGGMALAIDVGNLQYRQRQLQTAADSAAIAAGLEISNCGNVVCTNMKNAAAKALIEDGMTNSTVTPTANQCTVSNTTGLAMIINVAPCVLGTNDPNHGNTSLVEVVLTESQSTFFGGFLGMSSMNLVARSEAGEAFIVSGSSNGDCIYTKSLEFNSSDGNFDLTNCGIYDLGNLQTDDHDTVTASFFLYQGTWNPNNCNSTCSWTLGDSETQPAHTTTVQADPLSGLTLPTQPANSTTAGNTTPSSGATLQPGYYPNGVNLNSNVSVTLAPGVYYMNGSINVNSGATLAGTGVTLFFESGSLQMNSNSSVIQLSAPTTSTNGSNANMLIWEPSTNSSGMTIDTSSSSFFTGTMYLPGGRLTLNSGAGVTINASGVAAIDVNDLLVDDSEHFNVTSTLPGTAIANPPKLGTFSLAE